MKKPTVEWRVMTDVAEMGVGRKALSPYEILWDGDETKLNRDYLNQHIPQTSSFFGGYRAFVGDLEIGQVTVHWNAHQLNWPNRLSINGYSILDTKKRGGGYGRNFDDEVDMRNRTVFKRDASIDEAKAYVSGLFLDLCDKAGLVSR